MHTNAYKSYKCIQIIQMHSNTICKYVQIHHTNTYKETYLNPASGNGFSSHQRLDSYTSPLKYFGFAFTLLFADPHFLTFSA
jgi:hypothetical protein